MENNSETIKEAAAQNHFLLRPLVEIYPEKTFITLSCGCVLKTIKDVITLQTLCKTDFLNFKK